MTQEQRERKRLRDRDSKRRARAAAKGKRLTAVPRARIRHTVIRAGVNMPDLSAGLCVSKDAGLWFSYKPADRERAMQICAQCPIREACHRLAEANHEHYGVWAGIDREAGRKHRQVAA